MCFAHCDCQNYLIRPFRNLIFLCHEGSDIVIRRSEPCEYCITMRVFRQCVHMTQAIKRMVGPSSAGDCNCIMAPLLPTGLLFLVLTCNPGTAQGEDEEGPLVQVEQGLLRGLRGLSVREKEFLAFLGIPYAKPPTGELRFKVQYRTLRCNNQREQIKGLKFHSTTLIVPMCNTKELSKIKTK